MMQFFLWSVVVIYLAGVVVFTTINLGMGPVTLPLAVVRGVVWPVWLATGWPQGTRSGFD